MTVGRTQTIVRLQTGNRRKDHGTENFGGFVYVLDRFPQRDLVLWSFMCPINIIPFLSLVYISATTPRATTPHLYRTGHHAFTTTAQLSRLCISRLPRQGLPRPILTTTGYHACCVFIPVITPELSRSTIPRTLGYHTRHSSSYFIVYLSPAFTPPLLLFLHRHRAPHATAYSTR